MKTNHFYSDENLIIAGPKVKYPIKTIDQIQAYFPELPVIDIWCNPLLGYLKIATYGQAEEMYDNGRITLIQWEGFQAIWRNLTVHFSNLSSHYEMK